MQVDESSKDSSKRQKVTNGADMDLEGLSWNLSGIVFNNTVTEIF